MEPEDSQPTDIRRLPGEVLHRITADFDLPGLMQVLQAGIQVPLTAAEFEWRMCSATTFKEALAFGNFYPFDHPIKQAATASCGRWTENSYCESAFRMALLCRRVLNTRLLNSHNANVLVSDRVAQIRNTMMLAAEGWLNTMIWAGANNLSPWPSQVREAMTHITVPSGVRSLSDRCFMFCTNLTSISLPESLVSIGSFALMGCRKLEEVEVPDSVVELGVGIFENCDSLQRVRLPKGLKALPSFAFRRCSKLKEIILPDGLLSVGSSAFNECVQLEDVRMPDSVSTLGRAAFINCHKLVSLGPDTAQMGIAQLPSGLAELKDETFRNCRALTHVQLPKLSAIGLDICFGCTGLVEVRIPSSIKSMDNQWRWWLGIPDTVRLRYISEAPPPV